MQRAAVRGRLQQTLGLSGPRLAAALMRGLAAAGQNVIDIGMVPTPVLYYATNTLGDSTSGVMVTGSHNPPDYNGFKVVLGGETLSGEAITALYQRIADDDFASGDFGFSQNPLFNNFSDHIRRKKNEPADSAFNRTIEHNVGGYDFGTVVAYDSEYDESNSSYYRAIAASRPFAGLTDVGTGTPVSLMGQYMDFLENGFPALQRLMEERVPWP